MPLPPALARFNRQATNHLVRRFAGRMPGFAIVVHQGRVSGRQYRTPVMAFPRRGGGWVIALTYGPDVQWARNVQVRGGCTLEVRGRRLAASNPTVVRDPTRRAVPAPVRLVLRLIDVDLFLELDTG